MRDKAKSGNAKAAWLAVIMLAIALALVAPLALAANPGHKAGSISAGAFEAGNYTFPSSLFITNSLSIGTARSTTMLEVNGTINVSSGEGKIYAPYICIGSDCRNSWPSGAGASSGAGWTNTSSTTSTNLNVDVSSGGFYVNASSDYVGIGTKNAKQKLHISDGNAINAGFIDSSIYLLLSGQSTYPGARIVTASDTATDRPIFQGVRSRGTLASPTVPQAGDFVFSFLGAIWDGSETKGTAMINFVVDGAVSEDVAPQRIGFFTSETNTTPETRLERLTIKSTGKVGIGTTDPSAKLEVSDGTHGITLSPSANALMNTTGSSNITITSSGGSVIIKLGG